jgi:hypothetical protein
MARLIGSVVKLRLIPVNLVRFSKDLVRQLVVLTRPGRRLSAIKSPKRAWKIEGTLADLRGMEAVRVAAA